MDAITNNYSLTLPLVGGDTGTWGGVLNNGTFSPLDTILGANLGVTINAADVNLSTSQFQNAIFVLTGVLTGNRSLVIPLSPNSATLACGGKFIVINNTTGNFNVTVKTAAVGSVGVTVPQGFVASLYSDQTNVGYAASGLPGYAAAVNGNPNGQLAGTAASATTNASLAFDYTNGILYVCTTTGNAAAAVWTVPAVVIPRGFDTPINFGLSVTHTGGNLLSVAVKTAAGANPSVLSPVSLNFQTVSAGKTTGAPTTVNITGALSMDTNAIGATLGTSNNTPFRIWLALFNNAGTAVLAMRVCSTATNIYPMAEYGVASTTAINGAAASAGVWYTPNGTVLTNCAFRLIGYCEYTTGLVTAGTYTADPDNTVIFGPGIKKPGDIIQTVFATVTGATLINGVNVQTALTASITPTSTINLIKGNADFNSRFTANTFGTAAYQLSRGAAPTLFGSTAEIVNVSANTNNFGASLHVAGLDRPNTTAATSYYVYGTAGSQNSNFNVDNLNQVMQLEEIMG